jgi:hypothetical protein
MIDSIEDPLEWVNSLQIFIHWDFSFSACILFVFTSSLSKRLEASTPIPVSCSCFINKAQVSFKTWVSALELNPTHKLYIIFFVTLDNVINKTVQVIQTYKLSLSIISGVREKLCSPLEVYLAEEDSMVKKLSYLF